MPRSENNSRDLVVNNVRLDGETYRALTMRSYHEHVPLQSIIGELLKRQLAIEGFFKNDFDLVHREIIKTLANAISDENLI